MEENNRTPQWKNLIASMSGPSTTNKTTSFQPSIVASTSVDHKKTKIHVKLWKDDTIHIGPSSKHLSLFLTSYPQESVYYSLEHKAWIVKLLFYDTLRKDLKKHFIFVDIPKGLLNSILKYSQQLCREFNLADSIYSKLLPFQREAVTRALSMNGRVLLADEMGLGKTYQALAIANFYQLEWPLLIISPASLLENWRNSITNLMKLESTIVRKTADLGDRISIVSYDIATRIYDAIESRKYRVIIADEIHFLKSANTKRCKTLLPILQKSDRLVMISGTPALSRPIELYTTFIALDKNLFVSMTEFGYRYCNLRKIGNFFDWKGSSNLDELYYILNKYFMIRRTKDDVMNELPSKFRRQVIVDVKRKLKKPMAEEEKYVVFDKPVDETIMSQYIEACDAKIDSILEYLQTMLEKKYKFIVFAHHAKMLDSIENFLKEKVEYVRIDGKTPVLHRQRYVDKFQKEDDVRVAVLSLTACSSGLTLTAAKAVIFAELYWNPGTMLQAEDRVHRIGQKSNVDIHYITALGTIDEMVWPLLLKKLSVLEKMGIGSNELKNIGNVSAKQKTIDQYYNNQ